MTKGCFWIVSVVIHVVWIYHCVTNVYKLFTFDTFCFWYSVMICWNLLLNWCTFLAWCEILNFFWNASISNNKLLKGGLERPCAQTPEGCLSLICKVLSWYLQVELVKLVLDTRGWHASGVPLWVLLWKNSAHWWSRKLAVTSGEMV